LFTEADPAGRSSVTPQLGGVPGFRDLLPLEAEILREAQESLLAEMRRWGYRHVITPLVENMDVLDLGLGVEQRRRLFKFADGRGDMVALAARGVVALESLLEGTPLKSAEHELLLRFPALRGGREILDAAGGLVRNRRSEVALAELAQVRDLLVSHGIGDVVNLDLGAI